MYLLGHTNAKLTTEVYQHVTPPSSAYGASWKARKRLRRGDFSEAAEGTRTLNLLHGKQSDRP
jgi:hypothetical protein